MTDPAAASAHWHLTFPEQLVSEPLLWELAHTWGVHTNIRRANVEEHLGWVIVEVRGGTQALDAGRRWLVERGVQVRDLPE